MSVRGRFLLGLLLTLVSGVAALSHQLLWTQRMTDLLGSSVESTTRVFGAFFLGLSCGAAVISRVVSRVSRPWRAMAWAEVAVALLCLPVVWLSAWTDWIWSTIGVQGLLGWQGQGIKLGLSILVVFLPAFAMGTVFPLLVRGVLVEDRTAGRTSNWLYAANTFGGVIGLAATAGFMLYAVGVTGALWLAIGLNLSVGCVSFWVDRRLPAKTPSGDRSTTGSERRTLWYGVDGRLALMAFLSGGLVLGLEILAMELVMLVAPLSFHAPVAVLGSFILALAVAACLSPLCAKNLDRTRGLMPWILIVGALVTVAAPIGLVRIAVESGGITDSESLVGFTLSLSGLVLLSFGPGLLLGGMVFPNLLRMLPQGEDRRAGVGALLAINGFGGFVGAEVAYRVIVPSLGIYLGIGVVALVYAVSALVWLERAMPRRRSQMVAVRVAIGCVVICSLKWLRELPVVNPNIGLQVMELKLGREGNLAVVEHKNFGRGLLFSNQYLLGSTNVRYDQERQAHIPLLLHPAPEKVCFLGLATGITPSAALQHSTIESVDVVELSRMVADAAGEHFSEYNAGVREAASVNIVIEDGRTYIASQREQFDVVIGDLFLPWRAGVGRLYSVEHIRAVRASLRSGGVYCQWLPLYQFSAEQLEMVMVTFQQVFPQTYLFEGKLDLGVPVLGLVGYRDDDLDWQQIRQACDRERAGDLLKDPTVRHVEGLAMLFRGELNRVSRVTTVNTLDNMELELIAGLARILDSAGKSYLIGEAWATRTANLVESARESLLKSPSDLSPQLPQSGRLISLLREGLSRPGADRNSLLKQVFSAIPSELKGDRLGDWSKWAGPEITVRWRSRERDQPTPVGNQRQ